MATNVIFATQTLRVAMTDPGLDREDRKPLLRLEVCQWPGSDGLEQGLRPHGRRRGRLGAGVGFRALLVTHGFDVAPASHSPAGDLLVLGACGVPCPLVLRHLGENRHTHVSGITEKPGALREDRCSAVPGRHAPYGRLTFEVRSVKMEACWRCHSNPKRTFMSNYCFFPIIKVIDKHGKSDKL